MPVQPLAADRFLTPDDRLREVATILAAGLLRLSARAALATGSGEHCGPVNPPESGRTCLEVPDKTVPPSRYEPHSTYRG
jgi:hypothetical protein